MERDREGLNRAYSILPDSQTAQKTFTLRQSILLTLMIAGYGIYYTLNPEASIIVGSILFSSFYLCVVIFRAAVLAEFSPPPVRGNTISKAPEGRYVILVALYKEANQIRDLVKALDRLAWPYGKKEICLICEASDLETITAIQNLGRFDIRLMIVPEGKPRTKPRALNFALAQVTGDYLVLYDAEDRPHPNQLIEAAERFAGGDEKLACLQAPLTIDNRYESILTRFFAIEYDTLFKGILPALAKWKAPIPLGGTSNHFRLPLLRAAGGWDSFNVTEDADLGTRLARRGLDCETLELPTYEEAPATLRLWMRQRTRWIKGWLQTLLVHLRHPLTTASEMGWRRFFQFHMVLTSVVISVLVHPFFLVAFVFQMMKYFSFGPASNYDSFITGISAFNLAAGYLTYGLLAWAVQKLRGSKRDAFAIFLFPIYWVLISIAGWIAVAQLLVRPHFWGKTDHGSQMRKTPEHKETA